MARVCEEYTRPKGVMGGPCLNCGLSQPEHGQRSIRRLVEERRVTPERRKKANYIGAPACWELELAAQHLREAFPDAGIYQVGSSLHTSDWRDVDVRCMLDEKAFDALFPNAGTHWEFDARWLVMSQAVSAWLKQRTGLPIDFQFQRTEHANEYHNGHRNPLGLRITRKGDTDEKANECHGYDNGRTAP